MRDHNDVVFRGTIVELRDSLGTADTYSPGFIMFRDLKKTVIFRVSRVWKGGVGAIFEMPAVEETGACVGFESDYLKVGTDLLVYAYRARNSEYYTGICGTHKLAKDGRGDFRIPGTGRIPRPPKAQDSK
jgi:hypothetical protein